MRSLVILVLTLAVAYLVFQYFFPAQPTRKAATFQHPEERYTAAIAKQPKNPEAYLQRARVYAMRKEYAKAEADLRKAQALSTAPSMKIDILAVLNGMHQEQGDFAASRRDMEAILVIDPDDSLQCNNLAWLLATCPNATVRDGRKAVKLATRACNLTSWSQPGYIDTLAAAYAEAGDFTDAVKYQQQAKKLVSEGDQADFDSRLKLYQAKQPYREDPRSL